MLQCLETRTLAISLLVLFVLVLFHRFGVIEFDSFIFDGTIEEEKQKTTKNGKKGEKNGKLFSWDVRKRPLSIGLLDW